MTEVFILAGEASGDRVGGELLNALRARRPEIAFSGVGGEAMADAGLTTLFPIEDLAVMGYRDVIVRLPLLLLRARQVISAILHQRPDAVILIDAQVFSKFVAKALRRRGYEGRIVLYVAPAVWAWRPERAKELVGLYDEVLSVLPFEPSAMRRLGGPDTAYVGHPALAAYPFRSQQPSKGRMLLLPGSRDGEIRRHLPLFEAVVAQLADHPEISGFSILSTRAQAGGLGKAVDRWAVRVDVVVDPEGRAKALHEAIGAIAVSGTVTLELALAGVPHILTYVAEGAQVRMFKAATTPYIGLPNIIASASVVPEILFAHKGKADQLVGAASSLIDDPQTRSRQIEAFRAIRTLMENGAPEAPRQRALDRVLAHLPG